MITYGHAEYIEEAIMGVLNQRTDLNIEFIIADDCSPDATREIVYKYIQNHKNGHWIKYTRHDKNKGIIGNYLWALKKCKGKYIALCEGDDYWTDPLKLQKQVDYMDSNHECSMTTHNSIVLLGEKTNAEVVNQPYPIEGAIPFEDLIRRTYSQVPTASIVIRSNVVRNYPKGLLNAPVGDYYLVLLALLKGYIYHFNTSMSVYRKHEKSWTNEEKDINWFINHHKRHIEALNFFNKYSNFKYQHDIFVFKKNKTIELFTGVIENGIIDSNRYYKTYLEEQRKVLTIKDYIELVKYFVKNKVKRFIRK